MKADKTIKLGRVAILCLKKPPLAIIPNAYIDESGPWFAYNPARWIPELWFIFTRDAEGNSCPDTERFVDLPGRHASREPAVEEAKAMRRQFQDPLALLAFTVRTAP